MLIRNFINTGFGIIVVLVLNCCSNSIYSTKMRRSFSKWVYSYNSHFYKPGLVNLQLHKPNYFSIKNFRSKPIIIDTQFITSDISKMSPCSLEKLKKLNNEGKILHPLFIGYSMLDFMQGEVDEAIKKLEMALTEKNISQLNYENIVYLLGYGFFKKKDFDKALKFFLQFYELVKNKEPDPDLIYVQKHLSDIYTYTSDYDKAIKISSSNMEIQEKINCKYYLYTLGLKQKQSTHFEV